MHANDQSDYERHLEQAVAQLGFDLEQAEQRRRRLARIAVLIGAAVAVVLLSGGVFWALLADSAATASPVPVSVQGGATAAVPNSATRSATVPAAQLSSAPAAPHEQAAKHTSATASARKVAAQKVSITIGTAGYEPSKVRVAAGRPIEITVGKGEGCGAGFLIPSLSISKDNSNGSVTFTVGPLSAGTYTFTCGMGMVSGQLVVG